MKPVTRRLALIFLLGGCLGLALLAWFDYEACLRARKSLLVDGLTLPSGSTNTAKANDVYHQAVGFVLFQELYERAPDVLFLNDSTMGGHSDDESHVPMDKLLARESGGLSVKGVSGSGYTALVYECYAELVARAAHKPKLVIFPLNPRSLSSPFFFSEDYAYARVIRFFPLITENLSARWWLSRLPGRLAGVDPVKTASAASDKARDYFAARARDQSAFGLPPQNLSEEELSIRRHFLENYMSVDVDVAHPMLAALFRTAKRLSAAGVHVLVYVTPVDVNEGSRLTNSLFISRMRLDVEAVRQVALASGADFLDLSETLDSDCFVDKEYACEHLNLRGRVSVTRALAAKTREMLGLAAH